MSNWFWKRDLKAALAFLVAAASLVPISLSLFLLPLPVQNALGSGPLADLANQIFFLPQHAFPTELRGPHGIAPSWLTPVAWLILAALFALGTRRLRFRWVVVIALPVVVLCVLAFTDILQNFGYSVILDGP